MRFEQAYDAFFVHKYGEILSNHKFLSFVYDQLIDGEYFNYGDLSLIVECFQVMLFTGIIINVFVYFLYM